MSDLTFTKLQTEVSEWSRRNFPGKQPVDPFLGMVEEMGELSHAILKAKQGIRGTTEEHREAILDAVADLIIFTADFCDQNDIDFGGVVKHTWNQVKQRNWVANPLTGKSE